MRFLNGTRVPRKQGVPFMTSGSVTITDSIRRLLQLFRPFVVFLELRRDLFGDIRARAAEFSAEAPLRRGPDHVAVLIDKPDGRDRLMPSLAGVLAFVFAESD